MIANSSLSQNQQKVPEDLHSHSGHYGGHSHVLSKRDIKNYADEVKVDEKFPGYYNTMATVYKMEGANWLRWCENHQAIQKQQ